MKRVFIFLTCIVYCSTNCYALPPAGYLASAVIQYKMNDNAATTTVSNTVASSGTASTNTSNLSVVGKINSAFEFGGSEYVSSSFSGIEDNHARTISLWFKTSTAYLMSFCGWGTTNNLRRFLLQIQADGSIRIDCKGVYYATSSVSELNNGAWHHIVVSCPESATLNDCELYIDGSKDTGLSVNSSGTLNTDAGYFRVGCHYEGGSERVFYTGVIDDFRIWSSQLSADQIALLYNSGTGTEDGLDVEEPENPNVQVIGGNLF